MRGEDEVGRQGLRRVGAGLVVEVVAWGVVWEVDVGDGFGRAGEKEGG